MGLIKSVGLKLKRLIVKAKGLPQKCMLALAAPGVVPMSSGATFDTSTITNAVSKVLTAVQIVGGAMLGICIAAAAIQFFFGDREHFQLGKTRIIGMIIGAFLLFSATALSTFIKSVFPTTP